MKGWKIVQTELLLAEIAKNRYNITKLAKEMEITPKTLSVKLNHKPETFTLGEICKMIKILKINNPEEIFFDMQRGRVICMKDYSLRRI